MLVNGNAVIELDLVLPRLGYWHAITRVDLADASQLQGNVQLQLDDDGNVVLQGYARRAGGFLDASHLWIVGGKAGGLATQAKPKFYQNVPVRLPLTELLQGAGEGLAGTASQSVLQAQLEAWTVVAQPVGDAIESLLEEAPAGTGYRWLPDGTFWVGPETWPAGDTDLDYQVLDDRPEEDRQEIGLVAPILMPGTTLGGRKVSYVEARGRSARIRATAWFEP